MKKIIRLTESDLVKLVKKVISEQSNAECKKQKTAQEIFNKMRKEGKGYYFTCLDIPQMFANKIKSIPQQQGVFKYNKSSNTLELYEGNSSLWVMFTGNFFGDKIGNVKMSPKFASIVPEINVNDNDVPYWVVENGKLCLFVGGFC